LQRRLLLPRHALHSALLEIEGGDRWLSALPGDLAAFVEEASPCDLSSRAERRISDYFCPPSGRK
jgi:hypothetical protein